MADKTIGGLTETVTIQSTDVFPSAHNSGVDTKTRVSLLNTYMNANVQLPSTAKVTGLDTALSAKVSGPASATNNAVVRYDSTTGKLIKNSLVTVDDSGNMVIPGGLNLTGLLDGGDASFGQVDVADSLNANGGINLPAYTPTEIFVSTGGNNSNNGSNVQPLRHTDYADTNAIDGTTVFVAPMTDTFGQFLKRSGVDIIGTTKETTSLTSSNLLGIDNTQWIATTAPHFGIYNVTMDGVSTSYFPSEYVENSTQIFKNGKIIPDYLGGLLTNLTIENQELSNPTIKDCVNCKITNSIISGDSVHDGTDGDSVPVYSIYIKDSKYSGSLTLKTGFSILTPTVTFNLTFINSPGITQIILNDNDLNTTILNISYDIISRPSLGIGVSSWGAINEIYLEEFVPEIESSSGEALVLSYYNSADDLRQARLIPQVVVGASSLQMKNNVQYMLTNAGVTTLTLPDAPPNNDSHIRILMAPGSGGFIIAQNSGDKCYYGSLSTTTGVTGDIRSIIASGITIIDIFGISSTQWIIQSSQPVLIT